MQLALYLFHFGGVIDSPFSVPVAGCVMILGIVVAGIWSNVRNRQIQSEERLAAIARGIPVPPTPEELAILHGKPSVDAQRRRANTRRTGIILLGTSVGIILFFLVIAVVQQEREVLCGAAVGLVPLGIGVGFLVDAWIQSKELAEQASSGSNSITPTN